MRQIKLHFENIEYLNMLLSDEIFTAEIFYLNPNRVNPNNILLYENEEMHSDIDTEETILAIFSKAIKRIIFSETPYNIEYINPFTNQMKMGLLHRNEIIINNIEIL